MAKQEKTSTEKNMENLIEVEQDVLKNNAYIKSLKDKIEKLEKLIRLIEENLRVTNFTILKVIGIQAQKAEDHRNKILTKLKNHFKRKDKMKSKPATKVVTKAELKKTMAKDKKDDMKMIREAMVKRKARK